MHIEFLGTAGYHPCEERHTCCIYLPDATPESAFLLDCGTGVFRLIPRNLPSRLHIFLSHAHLDHTMGLTFLLDVLQGKQCEVVVYGDQKTIDTVTETVFATLLFPVEFRYKTCVIEAETDFDVDGVKIRAFTLSHPGGSLGYRIEWPEKAISSTRSTNETAENMPFRALGYVTDTVGNGKYLSKIRDLDVLIHERNFADSLHEFAVLTGHCSSQDVAKVAREVRPKRLILTHFNPAIDTDPALEDDFICEFPDAIFARDRQIVEF